MVKKLLWLGKEQVSAEMLNGAGNPRGATSSSWGDFQRILWIHTVALRCLLQGKVLETWGSQSRACSEPGSTPTIPSFHVTCSRWPGGDREQDTGGTQPWGHHLDPHRRVQTPGWEFQCAWKEHNSRQRGRWKGQADNYQCLWLTLKSFLSSSLKCLRFF